MSIESGGGFKPDLYSRPTVEDKVDSSWIADIITPEGLARAKQYPAFEGHSDEWVIMHFLLAKSVESGPELDPLIRKKLSNLIGLMRLVSYPNLTPTEQDFMRELLSATTVNFAEISYEVTPHARGDLQWIWTTFDLRLPSGEKGGLPPAINATLNQLRLRSTKGEF